MTWKVVYRSISLPTRPVDRLLGLLACLLFGLGAACCVTGAEPVQVNPSQTFHEAEITASFSIRSYPGGPEAQEIGHRSALLREQIQAKWFGETLLVAWNPSCEIVLHATKSSYVRAVGYGSAQTSGSSLVR